MKKIILIITVIAAALIVSCNSSGDKKATENAKTKSRADSLMDDIMGYHGTSMAKMNKISVAQSRIRHVIDSINRLPGKLEKTTSAYKNNLDSLLAQLQSVENRMNQWMDEFNMDSLENKPAERVQYLESERQKVAILKDDMIVSLQKSDSLLGKKVKQ